MVDGGCCDAGDCGDSRSGVVVVVPAVVTGAALRSSGKVGCIVSSSSNDSESFNSSRFIVSADGSVVSIYCRYLLLFVTIELCIVGSSI